MPQTKNASTVQSTDTNVLEHIHSRKSVTDAKTKEGSAALKTKEKGKFGLQKKDVTHVAKIEENVTGHTHLLKHAAHAKHQREYAPLKPQKKDCRRTKNATAVLRIGESALANLPSRTNVLFVSTGETNVMHKT